VTTIDVAAGRQAPAEWLCVWTIIGSCPKTGLNVPVNPAAVQAALAFDTVSPTRTGTVRQDGGGVGVTLGVGLGLGVGVGAGVGAGVGRGVGVEVRTGVGVGTGGGVGVAVGPPRGGGVPRAGVPDPLESGPMDGVGSVVRGSDGPADPVGPFDGEPTIATPPLGRPPSVGEATPRPVPAVGGNPALTEKAINAIATTRAPAANAPRAANREVTGGRPAASTAAIAISSYPNPHSGQSPDASAQHHRHE
jgi:hypothetical protein